MSRCQLFPVSIVLIIHVFAVDSLLRKLNLLDILEEECNNLKLETFDKSIVNKNISEESQNLLEVCLLFSCIFINTNTIILLHLDFMTFFFFISVNSWKKLYVMIAFRKLI